MQIKTIKLVALLGFFLMCSTSAFSQFPVPEDSWMDSFSANGLCWCDSDFGGEIGDVTVQINGGSYRIEDICDELKKHPSYRNRQSGDVIYNDIQCGNGPFSPLSYEYEAGCPGYIVDDYSGCIKKGPRWDMAWLSTRSRFQGGSNKIVTITKFDDMGYNGGKDYAIDGNHGGANGQNVYLWSYNKYNVNQQWIEISRGNGYYSYQKKNTNKCLDGNHGGSNGQNLYLWTCNGNNRNQQWKKVSTGNGAYRLEKRNSPGYSIDGNHGGSNGQNTYLWSSNNNNANQQWIITEVGTQQKEEQTQDIEISVYPNPFSSTLTVELPANVDSDLMSIQLIDITGKVVYEKEKLSTGQIVQISNKLPSGVYALKWMDESRELFYTQKVVKQ